MKRLGRFALLLTLLILALTSLALRQKPAHAAELDPYHDSRDSLYRSPFGAVPTSSEVVLRLRAPKLKFDGVVLAVGDRNTSEITYNPMRKAANIPELVDYWEYALKTPATPTVLNYVFLLRNGDTITYYGDDTLDEKGNTVPQRRGGPGIVLEEFRNQFWQIAVYAPDFRTPQWMHNAVIYQIFPDRFRNGDKTNDPKDGSETFYGNIPLRFHKTWNEKVEDPVNDPNATYNRDFFGGDLKGAQEKLPYLKELGVTAIYFNPIFLARSNHRYDTADYLKIDPILGTQEDWNALVKATKDQGIRIILDGVFNHMSSDGPYFDRYKRFPDVVGACEDAKSRYRSWFFFKVPAGKEPTDACAEDGTGKTFYESWFGFDSIPKLNSSNFLVRRFIYASDDSVANIWIRAGAGGWRLDVPQDIDDGTAANSYWEEFRKEVKRANPEAVIIGEIWDDASFWLTGTQLDSTMNYRLRDAILPFTLLKPFSDNDRNYQPLTPSQFDAMVMSLLEDTPPQAMQAMMNLLGSHDTSRLFYLLGNDKQAQQFAAFLQFTMPGAPTIYYGDEIALDAPSDKGRDDPYNRAPYPWSDEAGSYYKAPDQDMLAYYKKLAQIRAQNAALREGAYRTVLADDKTGVYAVLRTLSSNAGNSNVLVVANRSESDQTFSADVLGYLPEGATLTDQIGGGTLIVKDGKVSGTAKARRGAIYALDGTRAAVDDFVPLTAKGGDGKIELNWPVRNALVRYNVYRSYFPVGGFTRLNEKLLDDTGSYIDTAVANGTRYYYYMTVLDDKGLLERRSDVVVAGAGAPISSVKAEPGGAVRIVAVLSAAGVEFKADIKIDSTQKQGVLAQAGLAVKGADEKSVANWQDMFSVFGKPNSYRIPLRPGASGEYSAYARFSSDGGVTWVTSKPFEVSILPPVSTVPPAAPANFKVTKAAITNVILTWDAVPGAYAYRVYRGLGNVRPLIGETKETSFRDVDAWQEGGYLYYVTAIDSSLNESEPSNLRAEVKIVRRTVAVTFRAKVPANTPANSPVFIAGDFGSRDYPTWNPAAENMRMADKGDGVWEITLTLPEGAIAQYKYVRGTWDAVEKGKGCEEIANRSVPVKGNEEGKIAVEDEIAKWRDTDKCG